MTTDTTRPIRQSLAGAIFVVTALLLVSVKQAWAVDYDGPEAGGSLIGAVRLIPESSYAGVPDLLEKYIKEGDETAWNEIKQKIDYTYRNLGHALQPVLLEGHLRAKIRTEIDARKKLFFKPNLVNPEVLSLAGDGSPGSTTGVVACTDWAFVAALMRFFHDELHIRYYQMALGDAGTYMPAYSKLIGCTPEALIEGTPFGVDAGAKTDVFTWQDGKSLVSYGGRTRWEEINTSALAVGKLAFGDFDGDGKTDVFTGTGYEWLVSYGGRTPWKTINYSALRVNELAFGDFDGDGKTDVFTMMGYKWLVSYGGRTRWEKINTSDLGVDKLAFGDFDGDGKTDVFTWRDGKWLVSYGGRTRWEKINTSDLGVDKLAFGDFDGDGKADVFTGTGFKWLVSYGGRTPWKTINYSTLRVNELAFSDFDGDGKTDVFTGTGVKWLVSYGGRTDWEEINTSPLLVDKLAFGDFGRSRWAGWPFYFVRKYLAETTTLLDALDDPMNGYGDSIRGKYFTPGDATRLGKLVVYDLNNAESFGRGREVDVPGGGDNYSKIVIHKALVGGDPNDLNDLDNYPGCVLVNCPILKVHSLTTLTNAIKNLGIGVWPMRAGHDGDPSTYDWRYAYPPDVPPGVKGGFSGWMESGVWKGHGVFHERWYVVDANGEGMPSVITSTPSFGLDGTMVDMNLAIKSRVGYILHVVDAVKVIDIDHTGSGTGVARKEGLIFASKDPVALDLLCARYMFKNLPRDPNSPGTFARGVPVPHIDVDTGAIVTGPGVDLRLSRSTLFEYAEGRDLGKQSYYVKGKDVTIYPSRLLVSKDGHFGSVRWEWGNFRDIMTHELYFSMGGTLADLQPAVLGYAQATDKLSGSKYHEEFMALDENRNGIIDDSELGRNGVCDCVLALLALKSNFIGKGEVNHGTFFYNSRLLKYADPAWNSGNGDWLRVPMDTTAFAVALQMATGPGTDEEGNPNIDPFFNIPYGAGDDGIPKWPSLQFARYCLEMSIIYDYMYASAQRTGKGFNLYVPGGVPYFPIYRYRVGYTHGLENVNATDDPTMIFTVLFYDLEKW